MRRFVLLAVVVGSQLAAGCYCYRPYLPRLQSGFGCRTGTCGGSLLGGGPGVLGGPGVRGIVAPLTAGIPLAGPVGTPLGYAGGEAISHGGGYPVSGGYATGDYAAPGTPGCTDCGAGGVSAGYPGGPSGMPLTTAPHGYPGGPVGVPYSSMPHGYPGAGFPPGSAPMPMVMPSAMPGGVPHDSALLKMPTIVPPGGPPTISKRPEELARQLPGGSGGK